MTHNQIAYAAHLENQRHNVTSETETERQNRVFLTETNRHNLATEAISAESNVINARHVDNQYTLGSRNLDENIRHNIASENIGYIQAAASSQQAVASLANVDVNRQNALTNRENVRINEMRANTAQEQVENQFYLGLENLSATFQQADAQSSSVESQNKLREAQRWKTYVNIGTDLLDSLSGAGSRTINSMSNLIGSGGKVITSALLGGK